MEYGPIVTKIPAVLGIAKIAFQLAAVVVEMHARLARAAPDEALLIHRVA
jgi:hypothetical protein